MWTGKYKITSNYWISGCFSQSPVYGNKSDDDRKGNRQSRI